MFSWTPYIRWTVFTHTNNLDNSSAYKIYFYVLTKNHEPVILYYRVTHKEWELINNSQNLLCWFIIEYFPQLYTYFFFAKSLNIPFTNYFKNRKAKLNLQIFIVNPILAGLYLSNLGWGEGVVSPSFDFALASWELGECDTCP